MASDNSGPPPLPGSPGSSSLLAEEEEEQVMSEVHLGCPPCLPGSFTSHFVISLPPSVKDEFMERECFGTFGNKSTSASEDYKLDEDGDLILTRRSKLDRDQFWVAVRHNITTSIPRVGMQVWKAELVLADFVLHKMFTSQELDGIIAIELGAGTGLVSMLLARVAHTIFITDHGEEILNNCAKNVHLNAGIFHPTVSVYVRELDWYNPRHPLVMEDSEPDKSYNWTEPEVEEFRNASLLLAADVIYNDDLTDAFFSTIQRIMSDRPEKVLYLAMEKRYNFSLDDLDVVANGYSHFRSYVAEGDCDDLGSQPWYGFLGKRVDLTRIPQYIREYERGNDVELWQIKYKDRKA